MDCLIKVKSLLSFFIKLAGIVGYCRVLSEIGGYWQNDELIW